MFEASTCGKIKRKITEVSFGKNVRKAGGQILSPKIKKNGYLEVSLSGKSKYIHRLIAETWIGAIPAKMAVNHKDGNKQNNSVDNLEIVTYSQNSKHALENGWLKPPSFKGSKHPRAKTNEKEVLKIRKEHALHRSLKRLLKDYPHLPKSTITKIIYRESWVHI